MADQPSQDSNSLTFHFVKASTFQTVHSEGTIGTTTPGGCASLLFYTERLAIPQSVKYSLDEKGMIADVLEMTGKSGVVRELQVGVTLDLESLKDLHESIGDLVKELETEETDE